MWVWSCGAPASFLTRDSSGEPFHIHVRQGLRCLSSGLVWCICSMEFSQVSTSLSLCEMYREPCSLGEPCDRRDERRVSRQCMP
ncbi:unnamed protein product [Musa banksii]